MREQAFERRIARAKSVAHGRWRAILLAAGIKEELLSKPNKPCPACGGRDRFSFIDKEGDGNYFCRGCGGGDGFSLLMKTLGYGFLQALEFVERFCGIDPEADAERIMEEIKTKVQEDEKERIRKITRIWAEGKPIIPGDPVWTYLLARGVNPRLAGSEVRCHEALEYTDDAGVVVGKFPAMLSRVTDNAGRMVNIHRTYLKEGKKAPVEKPKKLMKGPFKGAFVRFGEVGTTLGLAEGIETALACSEIFSLPVWATLGVTNLANAVDIPKGVTTVRIYADNDAKFAGQAGAFTLAHKLALKGLDVKVLVAPCTGTDWLDFLVSSRIGEETTLAKHVKTSEEDTDELLTKCKRLMAVLK